jgi:hypothetical protein
MMENRQQVRTSNGARLSDWGFCARLSDWGFHTSNGARLSDWG